MVTMRAGTRDRTDMRRWLAAVTVGALLLLGGMVATPASAVDCPTVAADGTVSPAPVPAVDWRGCDLQDANLSGKTLSSARLDGANLDYANLSNSRLTDAVLAGDDKARIDDVMSAVGAADQRGSQEHCEGLEDTVRDGT